MPTYKLSVQAEQDLQRIYAHGVRMFGEAQADSYFLAFFEKFEEIAEQPRLYPSVDHIRTGYRRSVCGVDSIFYRISNDGIVEIMTIIGKQDMTAALDKEDH
jgi:toxin ParE1/3/4